MRRGRENGRKRTENGMLKEYGFYKGINLGGWLSQCDYSAERLDGFIGEEDFRRIAGWGLDHVRLPVDYEVVQRDDGSMIEEGLKRIDRALGWAEKYGLHTVLDLHKTRGFSFSPRATEKGCFENGTYQRFFYAAWECFAKRYAPLGGGIMFDLLNEITLREYLEPWKAISREARDRIRARAPEALILLGSYNWNSAGTVPELPAPYDARVAYTFHFYDPHDFTHQGAHWEAGQRDISKRFTYAESGASQESMEAIVAPAVRKAAEEKAGLYCGEYGVIDVVPPAEAVKWFRDVHAVFEKHGVSRSLWNYKGKDFGFLDESYDDVREEMLTLF